MKDKILLIFGVNDYQNAIEEAFRHAESTSKKVVALQILTSHLYHYGHNDIILSGRAKTQFLLYIRDEVLGRGEIEATILKEKARKRKISLEVRPVETEEVASAVVAEAKKGYGIIFLPKEEKKLFPLLEKTLAQHLRKIKSSQIVEC